MGAIRDDDLVAMPVASIQRSTNSSTSGTSLPFSPFMLSSGDTAGPACSIPSFFMSSIPGVYANYTTHPMFVQERLDALLRSKPESVDTLALKNELSVMRGQVDDLLHSLDILHIWRTRRRAVNEEERDPRRTRPRAVNKQKSQENKAMSSRRGKRSQGNEQSMKRKEIPGEQGDEQSTTGKKSQARGVRRSRTPGT